MRAGGRRRILVRPERGWFKGQVGTRRRRSACLGPPCWRVLSWSTRAPLLAVHRQWVISSLPVHPPQRQPTPGLRGARAERHQQPGSQLHRPRHQDRRAGRLLRPDAGAQPLLLLRAAPLLAPRRRVAHCRGGSRAVIGVRTALLLLTNANKGCIIPSGVVALGVARPNANVTLMRQLEGVLRTQARHQPKDRTLIGSFLLSLLALALSVLP